MIIQRKSSYGDKLRSYTIVLDKTTIGKIKGGETFEYSVSPGMHRLYMKIDWGWSRTIEFESLPDSNIRFTCGPAATGWKILFAIVYATALSQQYITLEQV